MKKISVHLGFIMLLLIGLAVLTMGFIRIYTKHDSNLVKVINVDGMRVNKAIEMLESMGLEGVVTDTVYKDGVKKLAVINQNPAAGLEVKRGRKIYLVVNTDKVPMVMVPDLAEKTSLQQAQSILQRVHLRLGKVIERMDPSVRTRNDEPVLAQYEAGTTTPIAAGTLIERNSEIDLVIGVTGNNYESDTTGLETSVSELP